MGSDEVIRFLAGKAHLDDGLALAQELNASDSGSVCRVEPRHAHSSGVSAPDSMDGIVLAVIRIGLPPYAGTGCHPCGTLRMEFSPFGVSCSPGSTALECM